MKLEDVILEQDYEEPKCRRDQLSRIKSLWFCNSTNM